jgi:hypothetical protein
LALGAILIGQKDNRTTILKILYENLTKIYPMDPGFEIWDPEKIHPGSGSRG